MGNRTYTSWQAMKGRCDNPKNPAFDNYGGRGIRYCQRWQTFGSFLDDMGERPSGTTLDRINNEGGYTCGRCVDCAAHGWTMNCRWATRAQQSRNNRRNVFLTFNGETLTVGDWAKRIGMCPVVLRYRIRSGWSAEKALTVPSRGFSKRRCDAFLMTLNGQTRPVTEWAVITGIPYQTIRSRLNLGWSHEKALTTPTR
jgi:hypothetical protein